MRLPAAGSNLTVVFVNSFSRICSEWRDFFDHICRRQPAAHLSLSSVSYTRSRHVLPISWPPKNAAFTFVANKGNNNLAFRRIGRSLTD
jgi:hypothetical protein